MKMKICLTCGKEIPPEKRKNKKYCSNTCYYENKDWSGANNPMYGKTQSDKTRILIGEKNKGKLLGRESPLRGRKHTEEHNKNISKGTSEALRKPGMKEKLQTQLGKHPSEETIQKLRIANRGQKRSDEAKKNMRIGCIGRPSSFKGRHHTVETKSKQHESAIKRIIRDDGTYKNTKPELMVKGMLNDLGYIEIFNNDNKYNINNINYIHQYYIKDIEHHYVADFYFPDLKIVIEEDGVRFHSANDRVKRDNLRTQEMEEKGYHVLRIKDIDLYKEYDKIKDTIRNFIVDCEINNILQKLPAVEVI